MHPKHHTHKPAPHLSSRDKYLRLATLIFLLASASLILFPYQSTPSSQTIDFVRNSEQLAGAHGSANRDYLFADGTGSQVYTGQAVSTGSTTSTITTGSLQIIAPDKTGAYTSPITASTGKLTISTGKISIPTKDYLAEDCTTPWGEAIKHNDFVLAYQQRTDVPSICNIEKRVCSEGTLGGSYTQQACSEQVVYEYTKGKAENYNTNIVNPFVQPQAPENAGASFDTNGKINTPAQTPNTSRSNSTGTTTISTGLAQTTTVRASCTAPRGSTVNHGQFVKAYKSPVGLLDVPCETQLRLCVNGTLKGTYLNKSCSVKDVTYNDYLAGNTDKTQVTAQDLMDSLNKGQSYPAKKPGFDLLERVANLLKK
jgi:hypothetical protein